MRGTRTDSRYSGCGGGIIPAYAGNTALIRHYERDLGDHPRICGEHIFIVPAYPSFEGSSPHMRGTHLPQRAGYLRYGIIPAYAGNTIRKC